MNGFHHLITTPSSGTHVFPPTVLFPLHAVHLSVVVRVFERMLDGVAAAIHDVEVAEGERSVVRDVVDRPPGPRSMTW